MAVPFYVPDEDSTSSGYGSGSNDSTASPESPSTPSTRATNRTTTTTQTQQSPSEASSANQSPLHSPVSGEQLVQAFCEALIRISGGASPGFIITPSSPSCSIPGQSNSNTPGFYGGEFFFPNTFSPPATPIVNEVRVHRTPRRNSFARPRKIRTTSTCDQDTEDDEDNTEECPPPSYNLDDHYNFMAARESLQEFPGRVPQRKKNKKESEPKPKPKPKLNIKEQRFAWPTVVTAVVLAVGCGYLAAR